MYRSFMILHDCECCARARVQQRPLMCVIASRLIICICCVRVVRQYIARCDIQTRASFVRARNFHTPTHTPWARESKKRRASDPGDQTVHI